MEFKYDLNGDIIVIKDKLNVKYKIIIMKIKAKINE